MGNRCTSVHNIESNEFIKRLCASESISPTDPFWNQLFSFAFYAGDAVQQDHAVQASCVTFCTNNLISGNLPSMIRAIITRAEQLKNDSQCENPILCWQLSNALSLVRIILRYYVEMLTDEKIVEQFNASAIGQRRVADTPVSLTSGDRRYQQAGRARQQSANGAAGSDLHDPAIPYEATLLSTVIELLIDVPLNTLTYYVHMECLQVLLTALSSQAYRSEAVRVDTNIFYHHLVHGKCALHGCMLLKRLFANYASRFQPPRRTILQVVSDHGLLTSATEPDTDSKKPRKVQFRRDELLLQTAPTVARRRPEASSTAAAADSGVLYNATAYVASTFMYVLTLGRWQAAGERQPGTIANANSSAPIVSASANTTGSQAINRTQVSNSQIMRFETLTSASPHASYSALLILVLGNHCVQSKRLQSVLPAAGSRETGLTHNPYRDALLVFTNSSEPVSSMPSPATQSVAIFTVDYARLYAALAATCAEEHCTLLLYLLVHRNINLRAFLLSRTDLETLIVPLLHVLYEPSERNSQHVYMALIILLIISEDEDFAKAVHEIKLTGVSWFKERTLSEITLGSLMILVVIRVIHFNLKRLKDRYLHTNCLATLANMSGRFRNLHPYVAQRILGLINQLLKRRDKITTLLSANAAPVASSTTESVDTQSSSMTQLSPSELLNNSKLSVNPAVATETEMHSTVPSVTTISGASLPTVSVVQQPCTALSYEEMQAFEGEVELLEELLRMWLEIVNSCLLNGLQANANLLYALLYERELVEQLKKRSQFADLIQNLDLVLVFLTKRLETVKMETGVSELSVDMVTSTINEGIRQFRRDRLKKSPDLKFKYIEEDNPEEFFVPYIWSLIYRLRPTAFTASRIKLFEVASSPPPVAAATKPQLALSIDTSKSATNGGASQSPSSPVSPANTASPNTPRQKGAPLIV